MGAGSYERKEFKGGAAATALDAGINDTDVALVLDDATGWPTATTDPFVIVVDRGTAIEEKMLVGARTGTSLSSITRAYDDTTAFSHASGAAVEHVLDASTIDQANRYVNLATAVGEMIGHNGTNPVVIAAPDLDGTDNNFALIVDDAEPTGWRAGRLPTVVDDSATPAVAEAIRIWYDQNQNILRTSDGSVWKLPAMIYQFASTGARDTYLGGDPVNGTMCVVSTGDAAIVQWYDGDDWIDLCRRDEGIPKFADTTARDLFYVTPATGDHAYIEATHSLLEYRDDEWILINQKITVSEVAPTDPLDGDVWLQPT
jgi:hypothetical protein